MGLEESGSRFMQGYHRPHSAKSGHHNAVVTGGQFIVINILLNGLPLPIQEVDEKGVHLNY